jgi:hypothetical protein
MPASTPPQVFVSYSHHDDAWRRRLFGEFLPTTLGDCLVWSDAWLRAGDDWAGEIDRRLERCTVAVLLASPRFLGSTFIQSRELPRILERARGGGLRIAWIPIGLGRQELEERQPELAAIQAASPLDAALPIDALACSADEMEVIRQRVQRQLQRAVDPVGTELTRLLAPRYRMADRMAEGNRASVYRAHDQVLQREVAVKVLKDGEQERREAFMADVRRGIRLSEEPNFINLYDCGPADTMAYCVQQLVDGRTLRRRLDELPGDRPLPVAVLRRIFMQLTKAIARAHSMGFSYGNLKPGNIILDGEDEPFILPVGRRRDEPLHELRVTELLSGLADRCQRGESLCASDADDLAYLVPEQFGEAIEPIDPALVDQYMLGLLGWQMATGQRPAAVAEPANLATLGRSAFRDLPPASERRPLVPRRIDSLLSRMTARRPKDRYPDLQAVLGELQAMPDIGLLVVTDSWRRVTAAPHFEAEFFPRFYEAFLRRAPAARPFFAHFGEGDWARQHRLLKEAVLLLLAFHQQGDDSAEPNVLSRIAASHRAVPASLYQPFVDALVQTLCGDPGQDIEPFDPLCRRARERDALQEHWRDVLGPGIAWLSTPRA